jgi:transcriptional regulator with XRE-family HTH domain
MAKRKRVLTPADRRAAEKVRELWADYQKKNPGISQEVAAERADMGQSAFSQFLRGTVPMRVAPVLKFAKLFGVEPAEIRPDITRLAYAGARVVEAPRVEPEASTTSPTMRSRSRAPSTNCSRRRRNSSVSRCSSTP